MTKQEEIRERIMKELDDAIYCGNDTDYSKSAHAEGILSYLHSQGVVIKVEREMPVVQWEITGKETPSQAQKIGDAFRKAYAGYVPVVSLTVYPPLPPEE